MRILVFPTAFVVDPKAVSYNFVELSMPALEVDGGFYPLPEETTADKAKILLSRMRDWLWTSVDPGIEQDGCDDEFHVYDELHEIDLEVDNATN